MMSRPVVVILVLVLLILGLLWFLSGRAQEVPTQTIEVEVNAPANAQ